MPDIEELRRLQMLDLNTTQLYTLCDELLAMGTRRFQLSGRGEPFLHQDIVECIARLKKHADTYCFVNTNGVLLNHTIVDELVKVRLDELRITTMAGTSETYIRTHPGVSPTIFPKLKDTLSYLAQQKRFLKQSCPKVILACIVTTFNAEDLREFAAFAIQVGADGVLYRPIDDIGDPGLAHVAPTEEQVLTIQHQLTEAKQMLSAARLSHNIRNFRSVCKTQLDTTRLYQQIPCYYGWLAVNINPEGEVYACCRCYQLLGNIHESSFRHIWTGERYRNLRQEAITLPVRKTPVTGCDCYSCVHHTANFRVYQMLHPMKRGITMGEPLVQ